MAITTRRLMGVAMAVLLIASVVATVFLGLRYADARATADARTTSLEAAKRYATTMFGYNPDNVAEHIDQSMAILTGPAKPTYDGLISENNLAAEVREQRVVSEVTIQDAGVVTSTRDTSEVLIFMNQSVTRNNDELVRVDPSRLTFTMERHGDTWMVNGINVITDDSFRSRLEQSDTPPPGAVPLPTPEDEQPVEEEPVPGGDSAPGN